MRARRGAGEEAGARGGADGEQGLAVVAASGSASQSRELGQHLAAQRAVEERGGEQRGDAEAAAYGGSEHGVGAAERGAGGEPAGEHVVAERRQAGAAAEQPVEVGGGEPAVGGQVEPPDVTATRGADPSVRVASDAWWRGGRRAG